MTKIQLLAKVEHVTVEYERGLLTLDDYLDRIKDIALAHALDEEWHPRSWVDAI